MLKERAGSMRGNPGFVFYELSASRSFVKRELFAPVNFLPLSDITRCTSRHSGARAQLANPESITTDRRSIN
jgi:hypothetical protein